ncbi:MAG: cache domain-containing protein [Melioribacteraceae bacterium]|jgi:methyl-accepting chemotaxis protein|nr:cache domain-containing protein [Melioribacteraceae bacterium]
MKNQFVIAFVLLLNLAFFTIPIVAQGEKIENSSQDLLIKSEVETAVSMLQVILEKHTAGEMSFEDAKKLGADILRELKYGKDGYFWADTEDGVNVVLYGRVDVEGKNRLEAKDEHGNFYIKDLLAKAKIGGGYVEYWFTKKGKTKAEPKRSYVLSFKPFGWVVGTGYYR